MWAALECWAKVAPGLTPLVALVAVLVAWRQLVLNRINQRETTAKVTFRDYLKLAIENADLAGGDMSKLSGERLDQYAWFVCYFLWAVEEVLDFAKRDPVWLENVRLQMLAHREFFRNDPEFQRDLPTYSEDVQELVRRVKSTV
jgi:hypothetical protein